MNRCPSPPPHPPFFLCPHPRLLLAPPAFLPSPPCLLAWPQHLGNRGAGGRRAVGAAYFPAAAGAEAGALHARAAAPARGAHEDHGQRGHLLHAAHALHFHLQVSPAYPGATPVGPAGAVGRGLGECDWASLGSTPDLGVNPGTVTSSLMALGKSCPSEPQCSYL